MAVTVSITLKENSYSVANNTSSVTCKVVAHWTYSSNDRNNLTKTLTFAGTEYTTKTNINSSVTTSGSVTLFNKTKTITHNSDGSKTVSASVKVPTRTSSGTVKASKSLTLTRIPRYATCSQSLKSKTETTIVMNWSSDSTIDYVWRSINGGSTWTAVGSVGATSGSYTISGLSQSTAYSIKTRVRRKDSQLTTDSGALSVTTNAYPAPTSYQSLSSETDKTIVMNWSSSVTCDYLWYSINGGSSWVAVGSVNAASGSYTISGLNPNTTYSIKTRVRGKLSQKTGDSAALSVKTYENNYFTINLVALDTETTLTGIKAQAISKNTQVSVSDQTKLYSVRWTCSPAGNPSDKTVVDSNLVLSNNSSVVQAFTGLLPGTIYNVQADFYKGNVGTTLLKSQTVSIKTVEMSGTLKTTVKSSSTIGVALTNLPIFEYNLKVDLLFKQDAESESEWETVDTVEIPSGATEDLTHMFTGLSELTRYNFKANVYKVASGKTTLIKAYALDVSTLVYVPGLKIVPHFKSFISVPHTGKAFIKVESTEPANDQFKIHLYSSSVEDADPYTDLGEMDNTLAKFVEGTIGATMYYKVGVTDSELNVYNETEPLEIEFKEFTWADRTRGQAFDVTASEMYNIASAVVQLVKYIEATGVDITDIKPYYDALVPLLPTVKSGLPAYGGENDLINLTGKIASIILNTEYDVTDMSGYPITATDMNAYVGSVIDALETI